METEWGSKGSKLVKEGGGGQQEGEGIVLKKQHVAMGMDVLDCPGCSTPLRPPIFQCSMGHFVCSACRDKLPKKACSVCSWAILNRCHGMERVVDSIVVPCSYAMHGCADMIVYHQKEEHEEVCPHAPCFCPEKGCGFTGTTKALLDHFAAAHNWPTTQFEYFMSFEVPIKAGVHVLRGRKDRHLFLLRMASLDSPLHGVSLVRVEPHACESKSWCAIRFPWFKDHYQITTLDAIRSTSLSDGMPTDYFLTVPEECRGGGARVMLRVTIGTVGGHNDEDDLEADDYDESYKEEEDNDDVDEDVDDDESDEEDEEGDEDDEEDDDEEEEEACPHAPCFCPEKGCGFTGTTEALLDHFAAAHNWTMTQFQYDMSFVVPVKAGVYVLRGSEDGHLFLLRMASLDSPLHGVSLVRVEPHACEPKSWCSIFFSWFKGHYQLSVLDAIRSTPLSDGLPTDYFLTVPEACRGGGARVMLRVTIGIVGVHNGEDELEADDYDESYNEEEDSDDDDEDGDDDESDEEDKEDYEDDEEDYEDDEEDSRTVGRR